MRDDDEALRERAHGEMMELLGVLVHRAGGSVRVTAEERAEVEALYRAPAPLVGGQADDGSLVAGLFTLERLVEDGWPTFAALNGVEEAEAREVAGHVQEAITAAQVARAAVEAHLAAARQRARDARN